MFEEQKEIEAIQKRISEIPSFIFEQQKYNMDTIKFTLNIWLTVNSAFAFAILNGSINAEKMISLFFILGSCISLFAIFWTFFRQVSIQKLTICQIKEEYFFKKFIFGVADELEKTYKVCSWCVLVAWISFGVGILMIMNHY